MNSRVERARAAVAAASTLTGVIVPGATAFASVQSSSEPSAIAQALVDDPSVVRGATIVAKPPNGSTIAISDEPIGGLTGGSVVVSSGRATRILEPNTSGSSGDNLGGGALRGTSDRDVTVLRLDLTIPSTVNCIVGIDFQFFSEEYPEYVGSQFNDGFIVELDQSTWTTSGSTIIAPRNIAFDQSGEIISINTSGALAMTPANAAGTTFDGGTPPLRVRTPVTPGDHSLYFSVFDQGDNAYDSAVVIDQVQLGSVPDPDACQPGATVGGCTIVDIACFAPELRFDEFEAYFPMDPDDFVSSSALRWAADGRCTDGDAVEKFPDPNRLARGVYEQYESDSTITFWDCPRDHDVAFNTAQYTRPFGAEEAGNQAERPDNGDGGRLTTNEGFFLRWEGNGQPNTGLEAANGLNIDAPIFVEQGTDFLRYWIFYGQDPKSMIFGDGFLAHEGDWEHIDVRFDQSGQPTEILYYQHGCEPQSVPYDAQYLTEGTHPVVYVAEGTHAQYPNNHVRPNNCGGGSGLTDFSDYSESTSFRWQSWIDSGVKPVENACWYGFGGAWGDTGDEFSSIGFQNEATGPAGPPFKSDDVPTLPAPGPECAQAIGTVSVSTSTPGDVFTWKDLLTVSIEGASPGTVWSVVLNSTPSLLATLTVGADGSATVDVPLPVGTPPGNHRVAVVDPATGETEYSTGLWVEIPTECAALPDDPAAADLDGDHVLDGCDPWATDGPLADADGDGVNNQVDNCELVPNSDQAATVRLDTGDACLPGISGTIHWVTPTHYGAPTCSWWVATIVGTETAETIDGTAGRDVIASAGGDDTVNGHGGDDVLCGEAGNDTLKTGSGLDVIHGGEGNDIVDSGSGDDYVGGDAGDDNIKTGSGNDIAYGGPGRDTIDGGSGDDRIDGGTEDDALKAGDGADYVIGGDGNDVISGGSGDDYIDAGAGNDVISNSSGNDTIIDS